jgi:hypothetical protein
MQETSAAHPTPALLEAFDRGRLSPAVWVAVERHMLGCPGCSRHLEELPEYTLASLLREYRPPRSSEGVAGATLITPSARGLHRGDRPSR